MMAVVKIALQAGGKLLYIKFLYLAAAHSTGYPGTYISPAWIGRAYSQLSGLFTSALSSAPHEFPAVHPFSPSYPIAPTAFSAFEGLL
jgi:hypothetical protein